MENRKSREVSRRTNTGKAVVRDKDYYLNNLDIEKSLHDKAINIAERIFAAFVREKNIQVSVNTDDLADQIIKKLLPKLPKGGGQVAFQGPTGNEDGFTFDDAPVIIKTDKVEIKGDLAKAKKSTDSISDSLNVLDDFSL
jgi:hypothetical protein